MSNILTPIDARSVVTDISRPAESSRDVSQWFKDEVLELNFGETTGRPDSDITLQREYLARFLETGWTIDAVLAKGDSGHWVLTGGSKTVSKSQEFIPDSQHSSNAAQTDGGLDWDLYYQTDGIANVNRGYSSSYTSYGKTPTGVTVQQNVVSPSGDAPAYWTAYQKIRLKRRRLVAEYVMQSMITSFNDAYNNGRQIEDSRYNQIVSLYTLMLQRSEGEGNEIAAGAIDIMPLLNEIQDKVLGSISSTTELSESTRTMIVDNAIADINRQYDAKIASEKARQITVGLYNSTMWPTTEASYERQRAAALLNARAEGEKAVATVRTSTSETSGAVAVQLLQAAASISKAADERKITVVELRNTVLKYMLDYIGARTESYPELEEQETLVNQLGFSVGSAGSVL